MKTLLSKVLLLSVLAACSNEQYLQNACTLLTKGNGHITFVLNEPNTDKARQLSKNFAVAYNHLQKMDYFTFADCKPYVK